MKILSIFILYLFSFTNADAYLQITPGRRCSNEDCQRIQKMNEENMQVEQFNILQRQLQVQEELLRLEKRRVR